MGPCGDHHEGGGARARRALLVSERNFEDGVVLACCVRVIAGYPCLAAEPVRSHFRLYSQSSRVREMPMGIVAEVPTRG